jgi:serine/threonine protein kinase
MVVHAICPRCRGELPADAPEGLCPECLFRQSVESPGAGHDSAAETGPYERGFVPPVPAQLARHIPHLEILEFVGKGGMGAVYQARQPGLDRLVAVKVLPPEVARDPAFAERFSREARSLARFNHPNIVTVYDFGENGGLYSIIMEFVAGQNLRQLLQAGGLSVAQVLRIVTQVCDALQYAHDLGIVHRDIKPENILLDARGQVKIADFGLAKLVGRAAAPLSLTGSHQVMGTVYYMAPEQLLRNQDIDHRADIYSLGVVFYEMLTGELPVGRFAPPSQRARVDARLDAIVLRALEAKPEARYQDAAEIKRDIETVLAGAPVPVAAGPPWPCVRFTIPHISWLGAHAEGELYRDETTLILDFRVVNSLGSATHKEVRVPLADLRMISVHKDTQSDLPEPVKVWFTPKAELVFKAKDPAALAKLPAGKHGRGRLRIQLDDFAAAQQLVDSIHRSLLPGLGAPAPTPPLASLDLVRKDVQALALDFLLTAAASLISTVIAVLVFIRVFDSAGNAEATRLVVLVASLLVPACFALLGIAAVQMRRLRSYRLCLAATLVAVLPWSPAWPVGLLVGIWAVVVLGRPDVMRAFLRENDRAAPGPARDAASPRRVESKLRSFWHSFVGYFVPTSARLPADEARGPGKSGD